MRTVYLGTSEFADAAGLAARLGALARLLLLDAARDVSPDAFDRDEPAPAVVVGFELALVQQLVDDGQAAQPHFGSLLRPDADRRNKLNYAFFCTFVLAAHRVRWLVSLSAQSADVA